jgi:hypothetical protein
VIHLLVGIVIGLPLGSGATLAYIVWMTGSGERLRR